MRISTAAWYGGQTGNMARLQAETARLQQEIASGKRLRTAADDPVASARADRLARREAEADLWSANAQTAANRLESSSNALLSMSSDITRMRELVLNAANDTLTPADRNIIAAEVEQLVDGLLTLANSRDVDGNYLFAGAASNRPAYARVDDAIIWQGDGEPPRVPIGAERSVSLGDNGERLFAAADGRSIFATAGALIQTLRAVPPDVSESEDQRTARRAGIDAALADLDAAQTGIGQASAVQGARLSQVDAAIDRHAIDRLDAIAARSPLEDTDLTRAIVDLERKLTLLQAAQAGFTRISGLSLFQRL